MTSSKDKKERAQIERKTRLETFESRLMMTADPLTNVAVTEVDSDLTSDAVQVAPQIQQVQIAGTTNSIASDYGFDGSGQTVAVIDSGIAWDHYALGGGLGKGHKVVGGWDFAENDANPYDDGPGGFHGTHVAGVIGSTDSQYQGIATGADLVALRVFDDYGQSDFEWVEKSLQWVHDNQNSFENPITTVNMSLGIKWNSENVPGWSMIEDELAQLQEDGIFVAVAAGNSFQSFGSKGLSYPAASDHVVPVASHDADGTMSDFSQRNNRVLVAPGDQIRSTVPNHLLGGSGAADSFYTASGTSMATPYVAGASTLVRQAMEFMGEKNIDQGDIYDLFRKTADKIYDNVTNTYYHQLNLENALDAVVGDDFGFNMSRAGDFGTLKTNLTINGTIGKTNDVDYLSFTANQTGTVEFTVSQTHDLDANVGLVGGKLTHISGNRYSMDVEAGVKYFLHLTTDDGVGHYKINMSLGDTAENIERADFGKIKSKQFHDLDVKGTYDASFSATQNGLMTIQLVDGDDLQGVELKIFNSKNERVAVQKSDGGNRIDFEVQKGDSYRVQIVGESENVDVKLTNLVNVNGKNVTVNGTQRADRINVEIGNKVLVEVSGTEYSFNKSQLENLEIKARGGKDVLRVKGSAASETVNMFGRKMEMTSGGLEIQARSSDNIVVFGGGGDDVANIRDTARQDTLTARENYARVTSSIHRNTVKNFDQITVESTRKGDDVANFIGVDPISVVKGNSILNTFSDEHRFTISGFDSVSGLEVISDLQQQSDQFKVDVAQANFDQETEIEMFFSDFHSDSNEIETPVTLQNRPDPNLEKSILDDLFQSYQ